MDDGPLGRGLFVIGCLNTHGSLDRNRWFHLTSGPLGRSCDQPALILIRGSKIGLPDVIGEIGHAPFGGLIKNDEGCHTRNERPGFVCLHEESLILSTEADDLHSRLRAHLAGHPDEVQDLPFLGAVVVLDHRVLGDGVRGE